MTKAQLRLLVAVSQAKTQEAWAEQATAAQRLGHGNEVASWGHAAWAHQEAWAWYEKAQGALEKEDTPAVAAVMAVAEKWAKAGAAWGVVAREENMAAERARSAAANP
jgi:hypothetical protein